MTDREIMLSAEQRIDELMNKMLGSDAVSKKQVLQELKAVKESVHQVTTSTIDYQIVVDNLDDNILIADASETILYVNKAYQKSSGIPKENLIGKTVSHIAETTDYFTVTTVPDVIQKKEPVMKLSYLPGQKNPSIVVGMPIFYSNGELQYIIATNRELSTYTNLRDNYNTFLNLLSDMKSAKNAVQVIQETFTLSEKQMIGEGKEMTQIRKFISNVASTDATVLVTGESGTGKELIADAIYTASKRNNMPFIKINCSSIPAQLLESELFGYEKGAFSGANAQGKKGLFEAANKGTLLLDEIGDMPMELQAKLLRAIQSNEITRVGGTKPIPLDIRLIASTNCNLKAKIAEGTFRSDLYYRLHVIPINVPPLRERKDDIALLCEHYINIFNEKYDKHLVLSEENKDALIGYSWPGNIRELRNIMEYLVVCASDMDHLDNSFLYSIFDLEGIDSYMEVKKNMTLSEAVSSYEKEFLTLAIKDVKNLKEASEILDVDISTVSRKLKQHGLSLKK